jgi:hemolysin activation/secretion protein
MGLGGPDSVRGYIQSEVLGDRGYLTSAEYRQTVFDSRRTHLQLVGFFDHGQVMLERPAITERKSQKLDGAGVGARASIGKNLSLRLDLGFPLAGNNVDGTSPMIHGQMTCRW